MFKVACLSTSKFELPSDNLRKKDRKSISDVVITSSFNCVLQWEPPRYPLYIYFDVPFRHIALLCHLKLQQYYWLFHYLLVYPVLLWLHKPVSGSEPTPEYCNEEVPDSVTLSNKIADPTSLNSSSFIRFCQIFFTIHLFVIITIRERK